MVVEISNEQKAVLAEKISLCVEFLKENIQPHLVSGDTVSVSVGVNLDLIITNKSLYVQELREVDLFIWEYTSKHTVYLEKDEKSKKKKFICEDFPELAVEFLRNWEKAKTYLLNEVANKKKKISELDNFIDNFQL